LPNDSGFSRAARIHLPISTKTPSLTWVWALLASLWLVGCEPPPPTSISINPTTLSFTANHGGVLPASQQVRVDYVGYAVIAGYPPDADEPSWLKVTRVGSDARGALYQVSITSTTPPAASNRATIRFLTAQEDESDVKTVDLDVVYTLNSASLTLSPSELTFTASSGHPSLPAAQSVQITESTGMSTGYSFSIVYESTPGWLTVSASHTTPPSAGIRPNTTDLPPGLYTAQVKFKPSNGPQHTTLTVRYQVTPATLVVSPTQLTFTAISDHGTLPPAQAVQVTTPGGRAVSYSVSASYEGPQGWLTVPASATTPQTVNLRPNTTALPPGVYTAWLKFTPGNGQAEQTLSVTYRLGADTLVLSPTQLAFTTVAGLTEPPLAQEVQVTSQMGKAVGYSVSASYEGPQGWLTVPASATTPQTVSVRPNTTALPAGLHTAWLKFTPSNSAVPEQTLSVTYRVTPDELVVSSTQLTFTAGEKQSAPPPAQTVQVTAQQGTAVGYSVSVSYQTGTAQPWLAVPSSGTTPQTVSIRPSTTTLSAGSHTALVRFKHDNGGQTVELPVTYKVSAPTLGATPTQLTFDAYRNQSALPAAKSVELTAQHGQALNYQVQVSYSSGAQGWLTVPTSGTTPQTVNLRPNTTALATGSYTASVSFIPSNGQPTVVVSVSYRVSPMTFAVSSTQLDFTAISEQSALPAARTLEVTAQGQFVNYQVTSRYTGGAQGWLTAPTSGTTPHTVSLRPNTTALSPGQYTAVLSFIPSDGQFPIDVTVTYTVTNPALVATPGQPTLRVDAATTEAALTSLLGLTSTGGPLDWRVTAVSASWLDNTAVSGNTKTQSGMSLVLLKNELAGLANGTYSGTVTLAYGSAVVPERQLVVPVKLTVALPVVRTVMPYVAEAGRSLSHVLRGEGFSGLRGDQPMRFGSTAASTYQVISDTEIRLEVPALSVGAHPVLADNALGLSRPGGATLHAVQTPALAQASLPRARRPIQAIYDPLRLAVYTVDYTEGGYPMGLYRYRYANGTWTEEPYVQMDIHDAVMDVDGQSLYLTLAKGLYRLDLDDATATPRFIRTLSDNNTLAVLNDGRVLSLDYCSGLYSSLDGRRAMRVPSMCAWTGQSVLYYDASDTTWQSTSISDLRQPEERNALDRTARYAVVGESIYNAQFGLAATLGMYSYSTLFSHDARRLFVVHYDFNQRRQTLHVLDVSGSPVGGRFPKLAEVVVPGAAPGSNSPAPTIRSVATPDGRSLIKVDNSLFYVYPIPAAQQ
jgi:hypothetical protein